MSDYPRWLAARSRRLGRELDEAVQELDEAVRVIGPIAAEYQTIGDRLDELAKALDWIVQTVHRAHHEGPLESCGKATCEHARRVLARG